MPDPLSSLSSLWGGANVAPDASGIAPAARGVAPAAPAADDQGGFGTILARLRQGGPAGGGGLAAALAPGHLSDVRGKDKAGAIFTGIGEGMNAASQDAQAAAANRLANLKLLWEHQKDVATQQREAAKDKESARHNQATEGQAATNNKTLAQYYQGLIDAKKNGGKEEDVKANWDALDAKDQSIAAHYMMQQAGYYPPKPGEFLTADEKADRAKAFAGFANLYKARTGRQYPINSDGTPAIEPPPLPKSGLPGMDPSRKMTVPGYDKPITRAEADAKGDAGKWDTAAAHAAEADPSIIGKPATAPAKAPAKKPRDPLALPGAAADDGGMTEGVPAKVPPVGDDGGMVNTPPALPAPGDFATPIPTDKPTPMARPDNLTSDDATGAATALPNTPGDVWIPAVNPKTGERILHNKTTGEVRPFGAAPTAPAPDADAPSDDTGTF